MVESLMVDLMFHHTSTECSCFEFPTVLLSCGMVVCFEWVTVSKNTEISINLYRTATHEISFIILESELVFLFSVVQFMNSN